MKQIIPNITKPSGIQIDDFIAKIALGNHDSINIPGIVVQVYENRVSILTPYVRVGLTGWCFMTNAGNYSCASSTVRDTIEKAFYDTNHTSVYHYDTWNEFAKAVRENNWGYNK